MHGSCSPEGAAHQPGCLARVRARPAGPEDSRCARARALPSGSAQQSHDRLPAPLHRPRQQPGPVHQTNPSPQRPVHQRSRVSGLMRLRSVSTRARAVAGVPRRGRLDRWHRELWKRGRRYARSSARRREHTTTTRPTSCTLPDWEWTFRYLLWLESSCALDWMVTALTRRAWRCYFRARCKRLQTSDAGRYCAAQARCHRGRLARSRRLVLHRLARRQ
jgi:hypothetical protein